MEKLCQTVPQPNPVKNIIDVFGCQWVTDQTFGQEESNKCLQTANNQMNITKTDQNSPPFNTNTTNNYIALSFETNVLGTVASFPLPVRFTLQQLVQVWTCGLCPECPPPLTLTAWKMTSCSVEILSKMTKNVQTSGREHSVSASLFLC